MWASSLALAPAVGSGGVCGQALLLMHANSAQFLSPGSLHIAHYLSVSSWIVSPACMYYVSTFCLNCNSVPTLVLTLSTKMSQMKFLIPCDIKGCGPFLASRASPMGMANQAVLLVPTPTLDPSFLEGLCGNLLCAMYWGGGESWHLQVVTDCSIRKWGKPFFYESLCTRACMRLLELLGGKCLLLKATAFFYQVKWMMYWIIFALFTTAETFTDIFLCWWASVENRLLNWNGNKIKMSVGEITGPKCALSWIQD